MNWILFMPYGYGFNTRAKTSVHRLSFFALIVAPILINVLFMTEFQFNPLVFVVGFSTMYVVYEIGYIFNDVYTTNKEEKPTKWLTNDKARYVKDKFPFLTSIRFVYVLGGLLFLQWNNIPNYIWFVICLGLMDLAFAAHNYFRGVQNVFTNGALQVFKYFVVLLPFGEGKTLITYLLFIYFEIAFVRTVEFAISRKHILKKNQKFDFDTMRIIYYIALLVISVIVFLFCKQGVALVIGTLYMLIYRVFCKLLTYSNKVQTIRKKNGERT